MSSLKKYLKQRPYRERAQPKGRKRLGLLEKKKDYKKRAVNYHFKQYRLKSLREKAANRNPDEFYFGMHSAQDQKRQKKDPERLRRNFNFLTMKQAQEQKVKVLTQVLFSTFVENWETSIGASFPWRRAAQTSSQGKIVIWVGDVKFIEETRVYKHGESIRQRKKTDEIEKERILRGEREMRKRKKEMLVSCVW